MSTLGDCPKPYITADPDISGKGVRIAVYLQTLLSYAPAFLFTYDGKLDYEEERGLFKIYTPLLISSTGLLVTTAIQQATVGLGNYHILLVLNLVWMMNASALVLCVVPTMEVLERPAVLDVSNTKSQAPLRRLLLWWPRRHRQLVATILISITLTGMSVLGLWHWIVLNILGSDHKLLLRQCLSEISTTYLFIAFPITNSRIRILSLIFYSVMVIPILNVVVMALVLNTINLFLISPVRNIRHVHRDSLGIFRLISSLSNWLSTLATMLAIVVFGHYWNSLRLRLKCVLAVLLPLIIVVHTIIDTELTIVRNDGLVGDGESRWMFGQVLALTLVSLSVKEVISMFLNQTIKGKYVRRWFLDVIHLRWLLRGLLLPSSQNWVELHTQIRRAITRSREACAVLRLEVDRTDNVLLPCVATSAIFSVGSLLLLADQILRITDETLTFQAHGGSTHPPMIHLATPNIGVTPLVPRLGLNAHFPTRRVRRMAAQLDEAQIKLKLQQLAQEITAAWDSVLIAHSVRFRDITDESQYDVVSMHLQHLLNILNTALMTAKSLSTADACLPHVVNVGQGNVGHQCNFGFHDTIGKMSTNVVRNLEFQAQLERDVEG
ncbi:hypothetical protein VNI00_006242 [Paramarasmius palmivorus]|uniref:Uncharacterized protein n=1 Tax=Paramarasmius palmivorus TaxID=297713 RepID=A0AAW0DA19_9AGAR